MENENQSKGPAYFFFFLLGVSLTLLFAAYTYDNVKEKAIKDYIQHPENYELRYTYIKGDSTPVDLTVIKKKK